MKAFFAFLLAAIIVGGGWWWMERSSTPKPTKTAVAPPPPATPAPGPQPIRTDTLVVQPQAADGSKSKWKAVYHCEIDGKFVYSDAPCKGNGSKVTVLHNSSGITLAESGEVEKYRAEHPEAGARSAPGAIQNDPAKAAENRAACERWAKRLRELDAAAGNSPPAEVLDHIREQRTTIQKTMKELDCAHA